jgi:hypothetical protein
MRERTPSSGAPCQRILHSARRAHNLARRLAASIGSLGCREALALFRLFAQERRDIESGLGVVRSRTPARAL